MSYESRWQGKADFREKQASVGGRAIRGKMTVTLFSLFWGKLGKPRFVDHAPFLVGLIIPF